MSVKKTNKRHSGDGDVKLWIRVLSGVLGGIMILGVILLVFEASVYSYGAPTTSNDSTPVAIDKKLGIAEKEISVGLCYGDSAVQSFALASAHGFILQTSSSKTLIEIPDVSSLYVSIDGPLSFVGNKFVNSDNGVKVSSEYHIQISEYAYKTEGDKDNDNPAPINPIPGQSIVTHSDFDAKNVIGYVNELNNSGIFNDTELRAFAAVSGQRYYIRIGQFDTEDEAQNALSLLSESLIVNKAKIVSSSDSAYSFIDASTHKIVCELDTDDERFDLLAVQGDLSSLDRGKYNGYFSFSYESKNLKTIRVVNKFTIEEYVSSIIRYEITDKTPLQAAMAVATILRTNAYNMLGRHKSDGFDVCTNGHCHLYSGVAVTVSENDLLNEAVSATEGQIICYEGRPIKALYSLSAGRSTAPLDSTDADKYPYLNPIMTPWDVSEKWEIALDSSILLSIIKSYGYDTINAPIQSISAKSGDNDSLHISEITFTDILGNSLVINDRENVRELFINCLPSTDFSVRRSDGDDGYLPGTFVFSGYGNGSGVGLSISGAIALAEQGVDYINIINKYYTQTEVLY